MADEQDDRRREGSEYEPLDQIELTEQGAQDLAEALLMTLARLSAGEAARGTEFDASGYLTHSEVEAAALLTEDLANKNGLDDSFARSLAILGLQERVESDSSDEVLEHNRDLIEQYIEYRGIDVDDKAMLQLAQQLHNFRMGWLAQQDGGMGPTIVEFGKEVIREAMSQLEQWVAQGGDMRQLMPESQASTIPGRFSVEELQGAYSITALVCNLTPDSQILFDRTFRSMAGRQALPDSEAAQLIADTSDARHKDLGSG